VTFRFDAAPGWVWAALGVSVVLALSLAVGSFLHHRRRAAMMKAAEELGLEFVGDLHGTRWSGEEPATTPAWAFAQAQQRIWLFKRSGLQREFSHVIQRRAGKPEVVIADYRHRHHLATRGWSLSLTLAGFRFGAAELPEFDLRRFRWWHHVRDPVLFRVKPLGRRRIVVESSRDFARRWLLYGADEAAVRSLFTADLLSFFDNQAAATKLTVESGGQWLVMYRPFGKINPARLRHFFSEAEAIASAFLDHGDAVAVGRT
jgi:hypothetical protein